MSRSETTLESRINSHVDSRQTATIFHPEIDDASTKNLPTRTVSSPFHIAISLQILYRSVQRIKRIKDLRHVRGKTFSLNVIETYLMKILINILI